MRKNEMVWDLMKPRETHISLERHELFARGEDFLHEFGGVLLAGVTRVVGVGLEQREERGVEFVVARHLVDGLAQVFGAEELLQTFRRLRHSLDVALHERDEVDHGRLQIRQLAEPHCGFARGLEVGDLLFHKVVKLHLDEVRLAPHELKLHLVQLGVEEVLEHALRVGQRRGLPALCPKLNELGSLLLVLLLLPLLLLLLRLFSPLPHPAIDQIVAPLLHVPEHVVRVPLQLEHFLLLHRAAIRVDEHAGVVVRHHLPHLFAVRANEVHLAAHLLQNLIRIEGGEAHGAVPPPRWLRPS
mmetsp:Transcript_27814/g.91013  ORF Transcript_27814/g.91013 Transcript_27814/m.91013 type:complete len:300 (-) Transcript_27814:112-1011(-)